MEKSIIIGVMGGGTASPEAIGAAHDLGKRIAEQGWALLNGGRNAGIMAASARGAAEHGGLTIGILPDETDAQASPHIRIPILTGMGNARNCINVLTSHVVVACEGGAGTLSEIALALKVGRPVVLLGFDGGNPSGVKIFDTALKEGRMFQARTPAEVIERIKGEILPGLPPPRG